MVDTTVLEALNEQIKNELSSAYLYLAMAAYCEQANLPGAAHWLKKQAQEELGHGMKLYEYAADRGGRIVLQALPQPPADYGSLLDLFTQVLAHEQGVTAAIDRLYETAGQAKDYATVSMLQWFIDEQVEEEKSASRIVEQLKMAGASGQALLLMDRALGQR